LRIRAEADRDATVIRAEATGESERLKGEGEAERNRVLAEAFSKDPDFFAFYRSMQAYTSGLRGAGTRLVISPDSEFFRYFNSPNAKPGEVPTGPAASLAQPGVPPANDANGGAPAPTPGAAGSPPQPSGGSPAPAQ
jgi:membrane protease subunit HflC